MKKVFLYAMAALSMLAVSCKEKGADVDIDWSKVTVDGFYVAGPATGFGNDIKPECVMAAGFNEDTKTLRDGMYEKYIVLEGGKDFYLLYNDGGKKSMYGADLKEFVTPEEEAYKENPPSVMKGELIIGENAPIMRVEKTGLYHIVLDINKAGDLPKPLIVLLDASKFGVRGAMNSWGFTEPIAPAAFSNSGTSFVIKDQEMPVNGEYKFATGNYWKVTLDDAGKVKAETSLAEGMTLNGSNIKVAQGAGKYDFELTFKLSSGSFDKSFKYVETLTEASKLPEKMYMIGADFGGWNWESPEVVEMIPVNGKSGHFWAIRYFDKYTEEVGDDGPYKTHGFKFSSEKGWDKAFASPGENVGDEALYNDGGNDYVKESGVYMVYLDIENGKLCIEKAQVYGIGEAFGGWDQAKAEYKFVEENKKLVGTALVTVDGKTPENDPKCLRIYAESSIKVSDWWTREFIILDGQIAYRGNGGDQPRIGINAGQKIILDFNAGTGVIQ